MGRTAMSHAGLSKSEEIDRNLERFLAILPVSFFPSALDAQIAGNLGFDDGLFSIQPVDDSAGHLGYFSYAVDPRRL
jgi:hypothetical protein